MVMVPPNWSGWKRCWTTCSPSRPWTPRPPTSLRAPTATRSRCWPNGVEAWHEAAVTAGVTLTGPAPMPAGVEAGCAESELAQVVDMVLDNAIKYAGEGATVRVADGVVGAERDQLAVRGDLLHAALHQLLDVERVRVLEVLHHDHERPLVQLLHRLRQVNSAGGAFDLGCGCPARHSDNSGFQTAGRGVRAHERRGARQLLLRRAHSLVGQTRLVT